MPTATKPRFLVGTVEFDVLWADVLGDAIGTGPAPGPTPAVLRIGSAGRTHSARGDLVAASRQALCDRGLADRSGPGPGPARLLRLLAHPDRQLELRADGDPPVRAVAAARNGDGALAVRRGDLVELTGCDSLPVALLGALPPARPGPGRASSLPTAALAAALATSWSASTLVTGKAGALSHESVLVATLIEKGVPESGARQLGRMLAAVVRQAQIVALRRDRNGELRRAGGMLRVLDGPRGRYLLIRTPDEDGAGWTSVAPTDARRLRHRVSELLHAAEADVPSTGPAATACGPAATTGS